MKKKYTLSKLKSGLLVKALLLTAMGTKAQVITETFEYTGSAQLATLCASQVTIEVWGAQGGGNESSGNQYSGVGGRGGYSIGVLNLTPTSVLNVYVGGVGGSADNGVATGGWNGGGDGYASSNSEPGNGGGGASDVRLNGTGLSNRVIVAGGGGGGGEDNGDQVGHGGGSTGVGYTTYDATQSAAGPNGSVGLGASSGLGDGGGGGGGYYGGGSLLGTYVTQDTQGGGGGSGYIGGVMNGTTIAGNSNMPDPNGGTMSGRTGNGLVRIKYINNAAVTISASSSLVCSGTSVVLTASGPGSYTWSTGQTTSTISVLPQDGSVYSVVGLNATTGCTNVASKQITVIETPPISIFATKSSVCEGESVTLQGFSGVTYTWSQGPSFTPVITVTPTTSNNTYTLIGSGVNGCVASAVVQVVVNPLPVISVTGNTVTCLLVPATLTGSGADSYAWMSNNTYLQINPVTLNPNVTTTYSVTGTSTANCESTALVTVVVEACTGIPTNSGAGSSVVVYPNPNTGIFTLALNNSLEKTIQVMDVTGRIIVSQSTKDNSIDLNISGLSNGVYYIKVQSDNLSEVVKVVKQ